MSQRRKLGNVYAIPLPNGKFAYGREYKDNNLAISKFQSNEIVKNPDFAEIDFFVAVYQDLLTCGNWPKICNYPFEDEEDTWAPPKYIEDKIKPGTYRIYHKGVMRKATKEECIGLEVCAVWDSNHVIDRLMGNDIWTDICR